MTRTYLITGSAGGIGAATSAILTAQGHRVIGVDLHDADIEVDLTTAAGREQLVVEAQRLSGGVLDAVIANAGLAKESLATVSVNYFGAVATLSRLRELLTASSAPRAVATASMASLFAVDDVLVDRMLDGNESGALARTQELIDSKTASTVYGSTKRALARWIRRNAAAPEWAGAGIPLNAVAPGVIRTAMTANLMATPEAETSLLELVPMPLNGIADAETVAHLIVFLASAENTHLCGQVVFVDGGSDVVLRGDSTW